MADGGGAHVHNQSSAQARGSRAVLPGSFSSTFLLVSSSRS